VLRCFPMKDLEAITGRFQRAKTQRLPGSIIVSTPVKIHSHLLRTRGRLTIFVTSESEGARRPTVPPQTIRS